MPEKQGDKKMAKKTSGTTSLDAAMANYNKIAMEQAKKGIEQDTRKTIMQGKAKEHNTNKEIAELFLR
ncbi:MAG: hypothetical protein AAFN74_08475 [Myxococcota bacterium]